ncbi:MAG TPA: thioredoxin family protein [Pirellulales bacterium]|jgi:YHS domain-containing protein/thiol-disulfide isomerase/thioredoxin
MLAVRCWRSALVVLLLGSRCLAAPGGFTWESDLEAAKQTAARTNRLVVIHFGAPWCQPCQQLERDVFSQPGFGSDLTANYVGVKLNYDSFPATARQYGVQSIPTDVVITPQGQLIERVQSPLSSTEYSTSLTRVANAARGGQSPAGAQAQSAGLVQSSGPAAGAASNPTSGGRYADYFNQPKAPTIDPNNNPYTQASQAQTAPPPSAAPPADPYAGPQLAAATAPPAQPGAMAPGATMGNPSGAAKPSAQLATAPPQLPPGNAPLGLDGFCPVALSERHAWVPGDLRWGMQHHGRTYLFAGPEEQQRFQANPDRYSPVMAGNDPVLALDQGQNLPGSRMYGVSYADHVYLFTSEQTLQMFQQNPKRYAAEAVQARH